MVDVAQIAIRRNAVTHPAFELGSIGEPAVTFSIPYGEAINSHHKNTAGKRLQVYLSDVLLEARQQLLR